MRRLRSVCNFLSTRNGALVVYELVMGLLISFGAAIAVSQFSFGDGDMHFAIIVIASVSLYEFVKAIWHVASDAGKFGFQSNARRYFGQFWLTITAIGILCFPLALALDSYLKLTNPSLLCVLIFIVLLTAYQFISALPTYWAEKAREERDPSKVAGPYWNLGQVGIGLRMTLALAAMMGWILFSVYLSDFKHALFG